MVFVGGRVPWDLTNTIHYHSFMIYESDPITGMPLLLAGNPGRPRLVPWSSEARRTPKRTVRYRVRPELPFLRAIVGPALDEHAEPAPLSLRGP